MSPPISAIRRPARSVRQKRTQVSLRHVPRLQVCAVQARSAAAAGVVVDDDVVTASSSSAAASATEGRQETRRCRRQRTAASQPQNRELPLVISLLLETSLSLSSVQAMLLAVWLKARL